MGVVECAKHELLQPFNVLYEKEGECSRGVAGSWMWAGAQRLPSLTLLLFRCQRCFEGAGIHPAGLLNAWWLLGLVSDLFQCLVEISHRVIPQTGETEG